MGEGMFGVLPEGWEETTLGDVCRRGGGKIQTGPFGSQLHASDYVPVGIPTVMPANIGDNCIVEDGIARVRESDAQRLARHRLQMGDIVYSRRGDVERRALVRSREVGWLCGTGSLLVRVGENFADSVYISLWLGHPQVRAWITQHAVGATMANLNTEILSEVPVVVPPLSEQRAIAGVLGALDDKIESNRRKTGLLRMLIGAIYEDHEYKATEFEPLTNWATLTKGTEPGRDKCNEEKLGIPFIRVGDLIRDEAALYTTSTNCECADEDSVLVSFDGTPGRVATAMSGAFSSGIRKVDPRSALISSGLLLAALESASVQRTIAEYATGTTILHAGAAIPQIRVPLLGQSQIRELSVELENLRRGIVASTRETRLLRKVRETLLPELLSGRLRVRDAEKIVEEAV